MAHNAFNPKKHDPRLNPIVWDKYYIDREPKKVAKKTGEGDEDYVIITKFVETKRSIKQVIDEQADDVGLENILKKFAITGDDSILPENVNPTEGIVDMSAMPQDLIEADNYFKNMKAQFDALPDELKQGRDFNAFMQTLTQAQFDAYINSLKPQEKKGEEGGKE